VKPSGGKRLESGRGSRVLSGRVVCRTARWESGILSGISVSAAARYGRRPLQSSPGPLSQSVGGVSSLVTLAELRLPSLRVSVDSTLEDCWGEPDRSWCTEISCVGTRCGLSWWRRVCAMGCLPQCSPWRASRVLPPSSGLQMLFSLLRHSLPKFLPTRLETRTKESNLYASSRVLKLECAMNVKALVRVLTGDPRCLCPPSSGTAGAQPGGIETAL
jgi:hypothetical protein